MTHRIAALVALVVLCGNAMAQPVLTSSAPPIEVVVLGAFHFDNPNQDVGNVVVDDVLGAKRQAEIGRIIDGLAGFKPTRIAVESRARSEGTLASDDYRRYLAGDLPPSRSEVAQIGYALARRLGHEQAYAVDVDGAFPFGPVMEFAARTGREPQIMARIAAIQAWTADVSRTLKTDTLGQVLRRMNEPAAVANSNAFYVELLQYGALDEQPGVGLVSSWYARNLHICARVQQVAVPGDRVLVIYGSGHAYLLRQCLGAVPGWRVVEANDYLPE